MTTSSVSVAPHRPVPRPRGLVLHQVRKDVRRHRWVVLGWWTLLAGYVWLLSSGIEGFLEISTFLGFLIDMTLIAMTARVMFEDPLAGSSNAFWRTLPLPRPTLFGAKLVALAALLWLPSLVAQLVCLVNLDLPRAQILPALLESALWQAAMIATYALLASVVSGYVRYVAVVVLGTVSVWILLMIVRYRLASVAPAVRVVDDGAIPLMVVVVLAALLVMGGRHLGRPAARRGASWIGAAVVLVSLWTAGMGAAIGAGREPARREPGNEGRHGVLDQPIMLTPPRPEISSQVHDSGRRRGIGGTFVFPAPVTGHRLLPARVRGMLQLPQGPAWVSDIHEESVWSGGGWEGHAVALGIPFPWAADDTVSVTRPVLTVPPEVGMGRDPELAGTYTGTVTFDAYRYDRGPDLRLRKGASVTLGAWGFQITGVRVSRTEGLVIQARTSRILRVDRAPESRDPMEFALRPGDGKEPLRLGGGTGMMGSRLVTGWPPVRMLATDLTLDLGTSRALGLLGEEAPPRGDFRLLTSYETYVGSTTRTFTVEGFRPYAW